MVLAKITLASSNTQFKQFGLSSINSPVRRAMHREEKIVHQNSANIPRVEWEPGNRLGRKSTEFQEKVSKETNSSQKVKHSKHSSLSFLRKSNHMSGYVAAYLHKFPYTCNCSNVKDQDIRLLIKRRFHTDWVL